MKFWTFTTLSALFVSAKVLEHAPSYRSIATVYGTHDLKSKSISRDALRARRIAQSGMAANQEWTSTRTPEHCEFPIALHLLIDTTENMAGETEQGVLDSLYAIDDFLVAHPGSTLSASFFRDKPINGLGDAEDYCVKPVSIQQRANRLLLDSIGSASPLSLNQGAEAASLDSLGSASIVSLNQGAKPASLDSLGSASIFSLEQGAKPASLDSLGSSSLFLLNQGAKPASLDSLGSASIVSLNQGAKPASLDSLGSASIFSLEQGAKPASLDSLGSSSLFSLNQGAKPASLDSLGSSSLFSLNQGAKPASLDSLGSSSLFSLNQGAKPASLDSLGSASIVSLNPGAKPASLDSLGSASVFSGAKPASLDSLGSGFVGFGLQQVTSESPSEAVSAAYEQETSQGGGDWLNDHFGALMHIMQSPITVPWLMDPMKTNIVLIITNTAPHFAGDGGEEHFPMLQNFTGFHEEAMDVACNETYYPSPADVKKALRDKHTYLGVVVLDADSKDRWAYQTFEWLNTYLHQPHSFLAESTATGTIEKQLHRILKGLETAECGRVAPKKTQSKKSSPAVSPVSASRGVSLRNFFAPEARELPPTGAACPQPPTDVCTQCIIDGGCCKSTRDAAPQLLIALEHRPREINLKATLRTEGVLGAGQRSANAEFGTPLVVNLDDNSEQVQIA